MHEGQKEQFQSTIEIGTQVLKIAILINGGAAIALLTFLGNTNGNIKTIFLVAALKLFSSGIVFATLGGFLTYVAQRLHLASISKNGAGSKAGFWLGNLGVFLVFVSICLFAAGVYKASCAF